MREEYNDLIRAENSKDEGGELYKSYRGKGEEEDLEEKNMQKFRKRRMGK